jgi:ribosomal protein L40E
MSEMKNKPVLICKRCGTAYTFSLRTTTPDADGRQLFKLMDGIVKEHLCAGCRAKKSWYAAQGRVADFEAGRP